MRSLGDGRWGEVGGGGAVKNPFIKVCGAVKIMIHFGVLQALPFCLDKCIETQGHPDRTVRWIARIHET